MIDAADLAEMYRQLTDIAAMVRENNRILKNHTRILREHSRILDEHTQLLNKYAIEPADLGRIPDVCSGPR